MPPELDIDDSDDDSGGHEPHDGVMGGFSESKSDAEAEANMSIGQADLGLGDDDDIVAGFDGVDETESGDGGSESDGGSSGSGGSSSSSGGDPTIESAIEEGLGEVAAVGLRGQERKRVSSEMEAVASKFKIGYFGNRVAQKYLKKDIEEIPPEWGLLATLVAFGAFAIYKRPDGEEQVRHAVSIVKDRLSSDPEPEPAQQQRAQRPQQQAPQQMSQRRGPPPEPQDAREENAQSAQSEPTGEERPIEQPAGPMTETDNE